MSFRNVCTGVLPLIKALLTTSRATPNKQTNMYKGAQRTLWLKTHVLSLHNRHTRCHKQPGLPHKRQAEARALEGPERPRPGGPRASLPLFYVSFRTRRVLSYFISVISLGLLALYSWALVWPYLLYYVRVNFTAGVGSIL